MTFQTTAPFTHLSLQTSNRQAREAARLVLDGHLDIAPPYQRASVWSVAQRMNLVRSFLQGIPVPAVMLNDRCTADWVRNTGEDPRDTGVGMWAVIDGKQRIESVVAWFSGDLAVPASWFPAEDVAATVETDDGPYVTHQGLTERGQRFMSHRAMLPVTEAQVGSVQAEADLYLLVNTGGTAQTADDLINAATYATHD